MKNIPSDVRTLLEEQFRLDSAVSDGVKGKKRDTRKILVRFQDGQEVEVVFIPTRSRKTVCVSSQAGCRFNCSFCASGQAGFSRDLSAGEIVGQVLLAAHLFDEKPTHVVFMGVGEPFDNYDSVLKAVRILNDGDGLEIGARRITISTCGIIPGIRRLSNEGIQVELSVSLHAATGGLRSDLMPVNRAYPLDLLIDVCRTYSEKTNRIITFEYILIAGVNDSAQDAGNLARLLAPLKCRVNLLLLSAVSEYQGCASTERAVEMFVRTLYRAGINATMRHSRGSSSNSACGQLRYVSSSLGVRQAPS